MKFISLIVYRLKDKKALATIHNSGASLQMQQQANDDFRELAKTFRVSSLYEGMRESNFEFADDFPSELKMELGGSPIWFSTCDANLLLYCGKFEARQ